MNASLATARRAQESAVSVCALRGATKSYRLGVHSVPALKAVDLDLLPGEMVALTGPSVAVARANILTAKAQVDSSRAEVSTAQWNLDHTAV